MKRMLAVLLTLCMILSLPLFASAEQVKSVSIYTCYVENEALEMFEQFTKDTGIKVNLYLVTCLNRLGSFRTFNDWKSNVNGIAVENSGKRLCDNTTDTARFNCDRCMFSRRTTSKILIGNHNVTLFYPVHKIRINILHTVLCKFCRIR